MLRHFSVLIIIWNALWKTALLTSFPFLFDSNPWVLFLGITWAVHCPWTQLPQTGACCWGSQHKSVASLTLPWPAPCSGSKKPCWHVLLPLAVLIGLLGISVCSSSAWLSSAAFPVWTYSVRSTEHHSGTSDNCMRTVCRRLAQPFCRWSTECLFVFCVLSSEFQSQCLEQSHLSYLLLFFVTCAVRCVSKLWNSFEKLSWKILRKPMF